jgi:HK97 family phage major capsid protein
MKTLTQYREDIKNLMDKLADIDAKAIAENRDLTAPELGYKDEVMDAIDELNGIVGNLERQDAMKAKLDKPQARMTVASGSQKLKGSGIELINDRKKDRFGSLGEQLAAVIHAGRPTGSVDPRLFNATGMGETVPSDGGFLVQQDFTSELLQDVFQTGVLAAKCRRIPISGTSNGIKINGVDETSRASTRYGGVIGYWVDEAAEKLATKPKFRRIELSLKKLVGLCYATDELLQDAAALESFVRGAFSGEFGFLLDDAIINGVGAGMPLGVINSGCLVSVGKETGQAAATVVTENIVKMYARRFASQTQNYIWLYNQDIEPQLYTMSLSVGTGGSAVYMPPGGLSDAPYGRLMGLPAMAIEQCATLGTQGDIILANFPNGYILAEKGGLQADMSIHVRFQYDESVFRFVLRVDGQPIRQTPLTPYKGSNTQSHFITLDARA